MLSWVAMDIAQMWNFYEEEPLSHSLRQDVFFLNCSSGIVTPGQLPSRVVRFCKDLNANEASGGSNGRSKTENADKNLYLQVSLRLSY